MALPSLLCTVVTIVLKKRLVNSITFYYYFLGSGSLKFNFVVRRKRLSLIFAVHQHPSLKFELCHQEKETLVAFCVHHHPSLKFELCDQEKEIHDVYFSSNICNQKSSLFLRRKGLASFTFYISCIF